MKPLLKPFEELAIAWKSNDFFRARIKLTLFYIAILSWILVFFSSILFFEIQSKYKLVIQENILEKGDTMLHLFMGKILESIFFLDGVIIFFSIFLAYWFAGKTLKPIEEKMKEQKQFVSDAAHELKNPLSVLQASSESMIRAPEFSEAESREVFHEILEESQRLIRITHQLLSLESLHKKNKKINIPEISVQKSIETVIKKLSGFAEQKKIEITPEISGNFLKIFPEDLEAIVFNLVHNAIKFSPENSTIFVKFSGKNNDNKKCILSVKNFGKIIPQDEIPLLFRRFYKSDTARSFSEENGSGLGLSIVKKIVDSYNAEISVKSEEDFGNIFEVRF